MGALKMHEELRKLGIPKEEIVNNEFTFGTICKLVRKGIVYGLQYENNIYGSFVSVYIHFKEIPHKGWIFWGLGYDEYREEWKDKFSVLEDDFFNLDVISNELDKEDVLEYLSGIIKVVRREKRYDLEEKSHLHSQRNYFSAPRLYEEYEEDND